jgi:photosystem II stability/assembly factor-like uncharacterized protein
MINSLVAIDTNLFSGNMGSGVLQSSDKGKNWTPVNNGRTHFLNFDIRSFTMDGTTLCTETLGEIFRSVDI